MKLGCGCIINRLNELEHANTLKDGRNSGKIIGVEKAKCKIHNKQLTELEQYAVCSGMTVICALFSQP